MPSVGPMSQGKMYGYEREIQLASTSEVWCYCLLNNTDYLLWLTEISSTEIWRDLPVRRKCFDYFLNVLNICTTQNISPLI